MREEPIEFNSPKEALDSYLAGTITDVEAITVIRAFPEGVQVPKDYFKYPSIKEQLNLDNRDTSEIKSNSYSFKGVDFKDRIYVDIETASFPIKGLTTTDMLADLNRVKSLFIEPIKLLTMWQFIPAVAITMFSVKSLDRVLESFNRLSDRMIRQYILKPEHSTDFTQAFQPLLYKFLVKIGIGEFNALRFSETMATIIENDSAYRLRLEDLFTSSCQRAWNAPRREITHLLDRFHERDVNPAVKGKIQALAFLLNLGLLLRPKISKALTEAFQEIDFSKLQLDDIDTYWAFLREDYNAYGLSHGERMVFLKEKGWKPPKTIPYLRKRDLLVQTHGLTETNGGFIKKDDTEILITEEEVEKLTFEELNRFIKKHK